MEEPAMAEQKSAGSDEAKSGHDESYEEELAGYLQQRIKPNLNSGAIPLLARSIAKDIAHREHPNGGQREAEGAEKGAESDNGGDFEADMHELQAELGEDWILRFSVHGDDGWLTAEKGDGTQRVEAQTAQVISDVVARLNEDGGRSS
jgi:hypothetical protein